MLAHQFIIYVAVIEFHQDYESHVGYNEHFYSVERDAETALVAMCEKEAQEAGGEWNPSGKGVWVHSSDNMIAYVNHQVVNGPKQ